MPTPSSGTIKFSDLSNEFGPTTNVRLGAYRISQTVGTLSNLPLDSGVPQSGSISMSQIYNKRLNIVINYTNLPDNSTRLNARTSYDNNDGVVVIGGFRPKPTNPQNIKLFVNTNTRIGSASGAITNVALRTGNWRDSSNNTLTSVVLECGPSSKIYGAGGNGGNANAGSGANGTSAVGIDYPTTVNNQGRIQRGGGGGGAGANVVFNTRSGKRTISNFSTGGGGGGGAGFPFSSGGSSQGGAYNNGSNGSGGASGSHESAGAGGAGGNNAGPGGSGGAFGNGNPGSPGGSGGAHGFAFVIGSGGSKSGGGGTIEGGDVSAEPT
jgi:hypothetical protein